MKRKKNLSIFKNNNYLNLYFKTFFLNSFFSFYKFLFDKKKIKSFFLFFSNKKVIFYFFFNKLLQSNIIMFEKILKTLSVNNYFVQYLNNFFNKKINSFIIKNKKYLSLEKKINVINLVKQHYYYFCLINF